MQGDTDIQDRRKAPAPLLSGATCPPPTRPELLRALAAAVHPMTKEPPRDA